MQLYNLRIGSIIIFALLSGNPGCARSVEKYNGDPSTLDEFHFVARGKMSQQRGTNPLRIARMDNNGEILAACVEAKTIEQLNSSGIACLQSQLELLTDWDLLKYDRQHKTFTTKIHIYGTDKSSVIRRLVEAAVGQLEIALDADLVSLNDYLRKIEREKSLFAILYAYVLHSYSMEQFGEEIYRKPQLSAEHPFWNGFAWAIYPIKKFDTGVSFMRVDGYLIFRVSAGAVSGPDFRQFMPFAKDVAADGRVDDPELKKTFSAFNTFDAEGKLTVPVFDDVWSAKLENMAEKVYAKTIELVDSQEMQEILAMASQAQAAMFVHYEIRYALLKKLLEQETIEVPIDFSHAENNSPKDVGNLVFLMRPGKKDISLS
jgi:hypothetical protein